MHQSEIKSFLINYANGNHSEAAHERFIKWLNTASTEEIEAVMDEYNLIMANMPVSENLPSPEVIAQIESALNRVDADRSPEKTEETKMVVVRKNRKIRIAAAVGLLIIGTLGYWLLSKDTPPAVDHQLVEAKINDVQAPKHTKATITLSNGQVVYLDSINNGVLSRQGNINIVKTAKAGIAYKTAPAEETTGQVRYNTLYNPRGSTVVHLTLTDGTKVWLNAESSLRYPVSFRGNKRAVTITGEAYFEVAKDPKKEFLVDANGVLTKVLGTHFNINAYKDEGRTVVTLLTGAVRVESAGKSAVISPGQQVIATNTVKVVNDTDLDAVMAWRNGKFIMESVDVGDIMRQIARWYDVDIIYKGGVPDGTISGEVSRNLNLSQILKVLEFSGVHVTLAGRKVIVAP